MAYTAVKTVSTGDPWTARDMNRYVRDNFAAGVPDIMTTKGDIAVATANDTATRLGIGSNDEWLYADSGATTGLVWGEIGHLKTVGDGANQLVSSVSTALITCLSTETFDTAAAFTSDRFTCPAPGMYLVICTDYADGNSEGHIQINDNLRYYLYKNAVLHSVLYRANFDEAKVGGGYHGEVVGMDIVKCIQGDIIDVRMKCFKTGGENWYLSGDSTWGNLSVAYLPLN